MESDHDVIGNNGCVLPLADTDAILRPANREGAMEHQRASFAGDADRCGDGLRLPLHCQFADDRVTAPCSGVIAFDTKVATGKRAVSNHFLSLICSPYMSFPMS